MKEQPVKLAAVKTDHVADKIVKAISALAKDKLFNIGRKGYVVKRANGKAARGLWQRRLNKRMTKITRLCVVSGLLLVLVGCQKTQIENTIYNNKILNFKSESRGVEKLVIALIVTPEKSQGPFPVIISQHGSSRDGMRFPGGDGCTDEYSTRLIREGVKRGFAVVAIDAFHKTKLQPNQKGKFPDAFQYALDLKEILVKSPRFDRGNIFFTGFSYGAAQVNKSVDIRADYKSTQWKAVASVEPGCNVISDPINVGFPILMIKGSDSHYYIEPCQYFEKLLRKAGVDVTFTVIKGSNHFFSTNGKITKGTAVNGCRHNPVVRMRNGSMLFADGTRATRRLIRKRCFTREAGSGKNRAHLDLVINYVLTFFEKHKS